MAQSVHDNVNEFLDAAERDILQRGDTKICCPCSSCRNLTLFERKSGSLHMHLMRWGFMQGYTRWTSHGEEDEVVDDGEGFDDEARHEESAQENMTEAGDFVHDAEETISDSHDLAKMVNDPHVQEQILKDTDNVRAADREQAKLQTLVKDSETPLYPGCDPEYTRLSVTLELLRLKAIHNDTDG